MKKLLIALLFSITASLAHANDVAYSGVFTGSEGRATQTGASVSATYTQDLNTTGNRVSFQVTYSSYTGATAAKTFTNGSASTGQFTVSSNVFVLASTPTITLNAYDITYVPVATSSGTAKAISDAIMANSNLNTIVTSTWTMVAVSSIGVVYTTATTVGTSTNYAMTTSSQAALGVSGATMTGGTNSAYTINTPTITIASNGFVTGLQVLYTGSPAISGLTTTTTYYVSVINPNTLGLSPTFKLSSSLANAVAGTGIVLASSQTKTTADTYTLTPLTFANTTGGGVQLQYSNDRTNWTNATVGDFGAAISSVTFAVAGGTTLYNLGEIRHRYLRAAVAPPTSGGVTYTMTVNERYSTGDH